MFFNLRSSATFLALIGIELTFGRKAAFPYGLFAGLTPVTVGIIAIFCDLLMVFLVTGILNGSMQNKTIRKFWSNVDSKQDKLRESKYFSWLYQLGRLGVVISIALPMTGGVWTGTTLSKILGINRSETYFYIFLGSFAGSVLFVLSCFGLVNLFS